MKDEWKDGTLKYKKKGRLNNKHKEEYVIKWMAIGSVKF